MLQNTVRRFVQYCHPLKTLQAHKQREESLARLQNPLASGYMYVRWVSLFAVVKYTTRQKKFGEGEKPWQVEQALAHKKQDFKLGVVSGRMQDFGRMQD